MTISRCIGISGGRWLFLLAFVLLTRTLAAQTPSPALLVLEKGDNMLAIVDPATLKIVGRVPAGPDPHEIEASSDGKFAYISDYGGSDSPLHTISVVDLVAQKALPPIDLGALHSAHGLAFAGGKLYFTAETNKVVGRYDPATQAIDWLIGTGQDRTHMVVVSPKPGLVFTSNVSSATISIIEQVDAPAPNFGPPPGGPRKTWHITNVPPVADRKDSTSLPTAKRSGWPTLRMERSPSSTFPQKRPSRLSRFPCMAIA